MNTTQSHALLSIACLLILASSPAHAQAPGGGPPNAGVQPDRELVKDFDQDGDRRLNAAERQAARAALAKEAAEGRAPRRGFGARPGGMRGSGEPTKPGVKLSPTDVKSFPDAPLYDPSTLRTLFLEFAETDWEKELEDFHKTDVLVPAKLTVDGKAYPEVGVHFRGMSSYSMVGSGQKRSLNLSLDYANDKQNLYGYRTLNLLNAHEDPTFMRSVLFYDIARQYLPAPKANFVRVVINGESWGVFVNVEQFNKDFVQEWFKTKKGARWKVPGSPGGRGSLAYLGEDPSPYKKIYEIKSKDDPKSWNDLIRLTKVLNETSPEKLESALEPILDVEGALRFLALDNALINNDGYWIRTSDYSLYEDEQGRFHVLPQDANETFVRPGGPGFGRGGPGGRGGRGGFGPGRMLAPQILAQGDQNGDQKLSPQELTALGDVWFDRIDPQKTGKVSSEQFTAKFVELTMAGPVGAAPGGPPGRPAIFMAPAFFAVLDVDKDGVLTRVELKKVFADWGKDWDTDQQGSLNEEKLRTGLNAALPRPGFGGPGPGGGAEPGGPPGERGFVGGPVGPGGPGMGGLNVKGVELDPLQMANDPNKALISKLLAVPSLRARYLAIVREVAEKHLDWRVLGPVAQKYHDLLAEDVKADTRKLESTEAFNTGLDGDSAEGKGPISLKSFADQRRAYLLKATSTAK